MQASVERHEGGNHPVPLCHLGDGEGDVHSGRAAHVGRLETRGSGMDAQATHRPGTGDRAAGIDDIGQQPPAGQPVQGEGALVRGDHIRPGAQAGADAQGQALGGARIPPQVAEDVRIATHPDDLTARDRRP